MSLVPTYLALERPTRARSHSLDPYSSLSVHIPGTYQVRLCKMLQSNDGNAVVGRKIERS
jgi:hypothetical protein